MADEDITLDGKPLQSLRVADLKTALEQRNLPKSGPKNALIKRLKGALMLESLQRSSSSHIGLQPNSQIGEEMSQNSFIKQYLAKQQELLRQRLEREAQQTGDSDESPSVTEEDDDHTEGNDSFSYFSDKPRPMPSQPPLTRAEEEGGGLIMGQGMLAHRPDLGPGSMHHHQDSPDVPGVWMQRPFLQLGHEKPSTPSPPRAVASLSVRVVGQPDRQGLPPVMPRAQEKEGTAPSEPGSAQSVLLLSRSAKAVAGRRLQEDSDEEEDDEDDDDSEEDEEWGAGPGGARRDVRAAPQPQPPSLSVPPGASRSRRKLQPPQHIPPPQIHQPPMQLRHPTPPPSPPPELSFPLPDTPKQSPPDTDELEGLGPRPGAGPGAAARPSPAMQRQDSDSSSRSSSPEPPVQRRPGPLSLLVRKMESEGAFPVAEPPTAVDVSGGMPRSTAVPTFSVCPSGSNETPAQRMEREREQGKREKEEKERRLRAEKEREQRREEEKKQEEEREKKHLEEEKEKERKCLEEKKKKHLEEEKKRLEEEKTKLLEEGREKERKRLQEEKEKEKRRLEEEKEKVRKQLEEEEKEKKLLKEESEKETKRFQEKGYEEERERENRLPPWKRGQDLSTAAQSSEARAGSGDSAMDQGSALSPQASKKPGHRDASPQPPLSSPPPNSATTTTPSPTARKPRMFSDTPAGSLVSPTNTERGSVVMTKDQDSGSASDSDSGSDSSSSRSSSSSQDKLRPTRQPKKVNQGKETGDNKKTKSDTEEGRRYPTEREMSEPSAAAVTEVDADSETSKAQSASEANPENSEGRPEESTTPKAFAARKISLTSSKTCPVSTEGGAGGAGDSETGGAAGRKRRWGSSTAVTTKKPSISITTDSLKSLIPDIKVSQEAVVELHPDELQLSGEEDGQGLDSSRDDQDKGLKIRRTVTQVVASDSQENGQRNEEEEEEERKTERDRQRRASKDKRKNSYSEETVEMQSSTKHDAEATKVTPSDSLVRRSISQQKSGVSITIDDPVRTARQPSPPRGKVSNIVHVTNLVRPFTLGQLKELLNRTGSAVEESFWIDKIKSHCYVTYATTEEAVATRTALHGVKWPQSNPKVLSVDFCEQDELDFHRGLLKPDRANEDRGAPPVGPQPRLPPLMMPERDRERDRDRDRERAVVGVRDQWAEREREMQRRERARGEREWDRDKIREFARPGEDGRRSRSRDRERRRRDRAKSKERKSDKKEKADEPPAKLLDDLFRKTKAAPCIYWLPLSEEQAAQREMDRAERLKERERRRKELQDEDKKREEERKERVKGREKEGGSTAGSVRAAEGNRDKERDRDRGGRDREGDKRRDGYRPRGPSGGAGNGRRSHSRSNPRDRRR